jgi:aconitate hydratase
MGVLPMEFQPGEDAKSLKLTGKETFHIEGLRQAIADRKCAKVTAVDSDGGQKEFNVIVRVDTPQEAEYFRHGGILQYVLRQVAATA